jgi:hypothetical protein
MRPADCPAPTPTAPAALLDDATATAALKLALRYARQRWWAEGGTPDSAEYEDAACSALTACLAHYDRAREVPFLQYARPRIWGAVRDTWQSYRAWRELRTRGPYAQVTSHAHTLRPHVPALTAPVELAQVLRQLPAVAQQLRSWRSRATRPAPAKPSWGWGAMRTVRPCVGSGGGPFGRRGRNGRA